MAAGRNNHASVRNIRNKSRLSTSHHPAARVIINTNNRHLAAPEQRPRSHVSNQTRPDTYSYSGLVLSFSISNSIAIVALYGGVVLLKQPILYSNIVVVHIYNICI